VFYYAVSYIKQEVEQAWFKFFHRLVFLSLTIGVTGVLFLLQHWPGALIMASGGMLGIIFGVGFALYCMQTNARDKVYSMRLLASTLFVLVLFVLGVISQTHAA